jgi:uncharacterized protein YqjF (DUF2071 family)
VTAGHSDELCIDRVAPRARPQRPAIMRQDWHHVLFLHWPVPPDQLRLLLPAGLELDLYDGVAYVGLTPFTMTGVRPSYLPPIPFVSHFHETNLRTYVHVGGRDPGVWFFSLDASGGLAVAAARALLGLPYYLARIDMDFDRSANDPVIDYRLERRGPLIPAATCSVRYVPIGPARHAEVGTLEYFLAERYILYTTHRERLYRGRIHHQPWPLRDADVPSLEETMLSAAGIHRPERPPLAHYGREVNVEVFTAERVEKR